MASRRKSLPYWMIGSTGTLVVAALLVVGNPLTTTPAAAALTLSVRRRLRGRVRARLGSQEGSIMIEVLVGTLLLALTTAAVLDGMDGAQKVGRENRDRSAAATLVQQDLERLRSMPPSILANLNQSRTVVVAGVGYTVRSRTDWVQDASGIVSCTSDQSQAEYIKLSSTAYAPGSADAPVTATSLLTPPPGVLDDTGTATVKLTDRDGEPIENVSVSLAGTTNYVGMTNDVGCAVFALVPAGGWEARVNGLVNWLGQTPAESPITVAEAKTSLTQMEVDEPASLRAHFVTPDEHPAAWTSVSVANAKLPNGMRTFADDTPFTSKDAESLFPFLDGYGVFAGTCAANNPAVWNPDYYATSGFGFANLDPGEMLEPVQVMMPRLTVRVRRTDTNTSFERFRVYVEQIDYEHDCGEVVFDTGTVSGGPWSGSGATVTTPLPFGNYRVCAAYRTGAANSTWRRRYTGTSGMPAHRDLTGPVDDSLEMAFSSSTGSGQCTP